MTDYDVAIIGAGPAANIASIILKERGLSVCMIEKQPRGHAVLSESYFFTELSVFYDLKLLNLVKESVDYETKVCFSNLTGESTIDLVFKYSKNTSLSNKIIRINKTKLNGLLQDKACEIGVNLFFSSSVSNVSLEALQDHQKLWDIRVCQGNTQTNIRSRFLIDASGKSFFLTKKFAHPTEQRKLDSRTACFSHFTFKNLANPLLKSMHIISLEDGYLFSIPLSKERASIGVVLNNKKSAEFENLETLFHTTVIHIPAIFSDIKEGKQVIPVIPIINYESICNYPAGLGYLICGEAAAFLDPFFSNGIQISVETAQLAAQLTILLLNCPSYDSEEAHSLNRLYVQKFHEIVEKKKTLLYSMCDQSALVRSLCCLADPHLPYLVQAFLVSHLTGSLFNNVGIEKKIRFTREAFK